MNNTIVLGTGCFWCTEAIFKQLKGVMSTQVGYAGGTTLNPNYESVCNDNTGHAEVIKVEYYLSVLSTEKLLEVFFKVHDPTTLNRQGNDIGTQYRSIILYTTEEQKLVAEKAIKTIEKAVTEIKKLDVFYPAENYHADYFAKHGNEPYCQIIIAPKIRHFEEEFSDLKT